MREGGRIYMTGRLCVTPSFLPWLQSKLFVEKGGCMVCGIWIMKEGEKIWETLSKWIDIALRIDEERFSYLSECE